MLDEKKKKTGKIEIKINKQQKLQNTTKNKKN